MSKIIRMYAENHGKAMLIAALAAIFLGWLAFSPDAASKSTLYYFLHVMAIPADLFKAVINLVVPILVSSAIFIVAAGGAKMLSEKDDSLAGKKKLSLGRLWTLLEANMVEAAGIEPASVSSPPSALHAYFVYYLTFHWPGEQGLERRACFKFNCFRHKRGLAAVP